MTTEEAKKQRVALVLGTVPAVEEIDQFRLVIGQYDFEVIASESICGYLTQTSFFHDLKIVALPDYDENPSYLPGMEAVLANYDLVIVKERLGLYAYQAVKAKWRNHFRLIVWSDNLTAFPGEDIVQMRTIRREVTAAADAFIVQTEGARQALLLEGVEPERITGFLPWVESRVKRTAKNKAKALGTLGLNDGDFVIAHMGQIEWEEGLFDLAHAVKIATQKDQSLNRRLKIVFCGMGQLSGQLRERFVTLGLDRRVVYVAPGRDANDTILAAADCLFLCSMPARDRVEGDPYRLLVAMANEIPIVASRSPIVEEYIGKHRMDFCTGSADSLADALCKVSEATSLRNDIVRKNASTITNRYSREKVAANMTEVLSSLSKKSPSVDPLALDHQILEVEAKVRAKQYLAAIEIIDSIFQLRDVPTHHKANLYRLIGDCFTKLGDSDQGKAAYSQAAELDPYSAKAYIGLGTTALTKVSYDIAVLHFQKAVSLSPTDEMANLGLGLAFQGMDELQEANRWVMKALDINAENQAALFTVVKIAYDRGEFADAEAAVRRYLGLHPLDVNMRFTLAGLLYKLSRFDEALEACDKMLEANSADERALALSKQIRRAATGTSATTQNG